MDEDVDKLDVTKNVRLPNTSESRIFFNIQFEEEEEKNLCWAVKSLFVEIFVQKPCFLNRQSSGDKQVISQKSQKSILYLVS